MSFRPGARIFSAFRQHFQSDARRRASTAAGAQTGFAGFMNSPIGPKTVHFWYAYLIVWSQCGVLPRRTIPTIPDTQTRDDTNSTRAPVMKWGMVLAGASDFSRPASQLSFTQNFALMCTGAIWTRWCFVIRPKNVALAGVNALVFAVGATQVTRIYLYNQTLKDTEGQVKLEGKELEADLKATAQKAEAKAEKAVKA
jgi:hypothetical protein